MSLLSDVINRSIKLETSFDLWSIQKQESNKNPVSKCMDLFMKCTDVAFSDMPRIGDADAQN